MADNGAIEQLTVRTLSHVLGHDDSGRVGREPVTDFVKATRQVVTDTTLTGGGALSSDLTLGLSSASVASLALANSSLQPSDVGSAAYEPISAFASAAQGATADTALQPTGATNQLPRSLGGSAYSWVSVLFKEQQGGQLDLGTTYSIMGHTGPNNMLDPSNPSLWANRNTSPPTAGVNGFTDSGIATYQGVGSVSLYVDIAGPPPVTTGTGTCTATTFIPDVSFTSDMLDQMYAGQYIFLSTGSYWGKISAFSSSLVTVTGWFQNGNTSSGQVPAGTQTAIVGIVTKVWAMNANALLGPNSYTNIAIGFELGAGNYKSSFDLSTSTGAQANGLNIASIGPYNNHWALLITRQTGDGTFARGVYVAGTTYAAYTSGSWSGDTQAPQYGFLYNWTTGMALAVNGSSPGASGSERMYIDGAGNYFSTVNMGLGFAPTANNRFIAQGYGTAGATNSIVGKNSSGASTFVVRDNGLVIPGAYTVAQLQALSGVSAGSGAYATNGRRGGQGAGAGTGVNCFYDGTGNWIACDTGQALAA